MGLIITGLLTITGFVILMGIAICLRLMATGARVTNRALEVTRDSQKQEDLGRDAINFTANALTKFSKMMSKIAWWVLGLGGVGSIITGALTLLLLMALVIVGVVMRDDLVNSVKTRQEPTQDTCTVQAVGGYWEELDFCFEEDADAKVYTDPIAFERNTGWSRTSNQYKLLFENEDVYYDEYGFARYKDKDLNVDFYCIAWSRALFTEIGDKFRMTLQDENGERVVYVAMCDVRADGDSRPDSKGKSAYCYPTGSKAIAEFYLDAEKAYQKHPDLKSENGYYVSGNLNKIIGGDPAHDFRGHAVKIEHYLGIDGNNKSITEYENVDAKVSKSKYADGKVNRSNSCEKTRNTVDVNGRIVWVGDSRTVQLKNYLTSAGTWNDEKDISTIGVVGGSGSLPACTTDTLACGSGSYTHFETDALPAMKKYVKDGDTIVINYGVNGVGEAQKYIDKMPEIVKEYSNNTIIWMSANPVCDAKSNVKNAQIEEFNRKIKAGLPSSVTYLDTYSTITKSELWTKDNGSSATDGEGVHYNQEIYQLIYDTVRNGGGTSIQTNGVAINVDTRYYSKSTDGIYGSPLGLAEIPESVSQPFQMNQTTYVVGRAWQVNNPNGLCPLPTNFDYYLEQGEKPRWSTEETVKGLFTTRADIPIEDSILCYEDSNGSTKFAFVEMVDEKGYVQVSEVSGKTDKYAGYKARYYTGIEHFLRSKHGTMVCMFQPLGDGH